MTHTGGFKLDGKEAQLVALSYHFFRQVDDKGRPGTQVRRGELTVTIASDDKLKQSIIEWMAKPDLGKKGEIVLYSGEGDERKEFKKVEFENGYVVDYHETYTHGGLANIQETFTISAEKITVGGAKFDFKWPKA
jgi:type VI protein secretion system component Hcp